MLYWQRNICSRLIVQVNKRNSRTISKERSENTRWEQSWRMLKKLPKFGLSWNNPFVKFQLFYLRLFFISSSDTVVDWKNSVVTQQWGCIKVKFVCSFIGWSQGSSVKTHLTLLGSHAATWIAVVPPRPWPIVINLESRLTWSKLEIHSLDISRMQSIKLMISWRRIASFIVI